MGKLRGNCYVCCEAIYHLLGGKAAGWQPMCMRWEGDTHWFLRRRVVGDVYMTFDPTASQFKVKPDYSLARGKGFLTKGPSRRARALMEKLLWQDPKEKAQR